MKYKPTLDPWWTGFNTHGGVISFGHGSLVERITANFAVGTPFSMQRCLVKTLSNAMRLDSASHPVYGTPIRSNSAWTVPSSPYVPCKARQTTCVAGGRVHFSFGSTSVTLCPRDRSAFATAAPLRNDTSRSALGPPNINT